MSAHLYHAVVRWSRDDAVFTDNRYSRAHRWIFDDGCEIAASSSPHAVRLPFSRTDAVDPEEALVAAVSSCHMLFVLNFAAMSGFVIDSYEDRAMGEMTANDKGKLYVSRVTLDPKIVFGGDKRPTHDDIARLHARAHAECYIASSIKADVVVAGFDDPHA